VWNSKNEAIQQNVLFRTKPWASFLHLIWGILQKLIILKKNGEFSGGGFGEAQIHDPQNLNFHKFCENRKSKQIKNKLIAQD